nr:ribonuclease H-like domain, reverse transcriptase, RNA-dependent DNA polymerase [Tanacetum cinerariifolium]
MAIIEDVDQGKQVKEVEDQKVSLHEENVGYKETSMDSLWYQDNRASNRVTGVRNHFKELDEKVSGKVKFRDGSYIEIKGKEDITPYEAIKQRKPNLENLKVFGCIAYAKVPSQHLTMLDDRSTKTVYLGNEQGSKAYRLFDPTTQKICVSRDVNFKEDETWDRSEYSDEHINDDPEWTNFRIENLEETNEHHDQENQTNKEDNDFPNNDDDGYDSPLTGTPTHSETLHTPSTRMETIHLLLIIAANNKWEVHHLNVKSEFLHGELKEEVYVTQPEGFTKKGNDEKVYRLIKVLYGLRQAPRAWNIKLDNTLKSLDFMKCALEQAIYTKASKDSLLLVGVYVDDLIITGTPKKEINEFKAQMEEKFKMSDLGLLAYYLGIEVTQTKGDILIKQSAYTNKILKEAGMLKSNDTVIPMDPGTRLTKKTEGTLVNSTEYQSLIGCLRYLLHTRPELSYFVGLLSHYMQEPKEQHMKAIKQVLRYVKGTKDYRITYKHNGGNTIQGFSDTTTAATQALWLKRLLSRLTHSREEKITIMVDNKSAIALMKNPVFHGRSKHIDTKYHFIRECVEKDDIQVEFYVSRLETRYDTTLVGSWGRSPDESKQDETSEPLLYAGWMAGPYRVEDATR